MNLSEAASPVSSESRHMLFINHGLLLCALIARVRERLRESGHMRPQGVPLRWHIVLLIIGLAAPVEGSERMLNQRPLPTNNVGLVRAHERGMDIRHLRGGAQKAVQHPGTAVALKPEASTTVLQRLTVLVVGVALFNDFMLITMLVPIIPQLLKSPPPLGVERNSEVAMGILFASKDICQLAFAPLAGLLTTHGSSHTALIWSTVGLAISTVACEMLVRNPLAPAPPTPCVVHSLRHRHLGRLEP